MDTTYEDQRRLLDVCMFNSVADIAWMKDKGCLEELLNYQYDMMKGMITAGLFMNVVSVEEFTAIRDEICRWQYGSL